MAEVQVTTNGSTASEHTAHIPIAQLTPLLAAPASRSIKAVVTLTWPFSSLTGSVAFLLAEPDFRLRRTHGQVRVQFAGSSAKAVSKAGIASGDEVLLSLEGVEFIRNEGTTITTPGRGVDLELKFTERLVVQFRPEGSQDIQKINIDHPVAEAEIVPARLPTPESSLSPLPAAETPRREIDLPILAGDEWSSPAFIKRARTSYGSLYDSDYDPFSEPDGTIRGKGRKRTRLSSSWRYNSRSPTPESEGEVLEEQSVPEPVPVKAVPVMMDEACQTIGLEEESAAEALANFSRQATNIGSNSYVTHGEAPAETRQDREGVEIGVQPMIQPTEQAASGDQLHLDTAETNGNRQPTPADSLPMEPALLPIQVGHSDPNFDQEMTQYDQHITSEPDVGIATIVGAAEDAEDLYSASPVRPREEESLGHFVDGQAPPTGEDAEATQFTANYLPEDQYGHWQSINAQLSESNSPFVGEEVLPEDQYYVDQPQEVQYEDELEYRSEAQYPPLEDDLEGPGPPDWSLRPPEVSYPDLPHEYESRESSNPVVPPLPRSAAMSRSQSAISEHIDLTEDDEDMPLQSRLKSPFDEDVEEFEEEFSEEEDAYATDGDEAAERENQLLPNGDMSEVDDEGEGSDIVESYDEDEAEEDSEEESEGEDESMDEMEDTRAHVKGPPEVIEILSSDDEDDSIPPKSLSQDPRYARTSATPQQEIDQSEESDEDEESDTDNRILARSESDHDDHDSLLDDEAEEIEESQSESEHEDDSLSESERTHPVESTLEELDADAVTTHNTGEGGNDVEMSEDNVQMDAQHEANHKLTDDSPQGSRSPTGMQPQKLSPERPLPFQRQFNLDGADDALEVSYPDLPEDEVSQLSVQSREFVTEELKIKTVKQGNAQLPTPADTQLTERLLSAEQSFNSVVSITAVESENPPAAVDTEIILDAPEIVSEKTATAVTFEAVSVEEDIMSEALRSEVIVEELGRISRNGSPSLAVQETIEQKCEASVEDTNAEPEVNTLPLSEIDADSHYQEPDVSVSEAAYEEQANIQPDPVESIDDSQSILTDERPENHQVSQNGVQNLEVSANTAAHEMVISPTTPQKASPARTVSDEAGFTPDGPRRSTRQPKLTPKALNQKESLSPVTPVKKTAIQIQDEASPMVVLDSRRTPKGHDASFELALTDSPIKHDLRKLPEADMKLRLTRALRTDLTQFTSLKVLRYHMSQKHDVLGVATTSPPEPQRAKGGPRHYSIVFNITDPSIAPSGVVEVQVLRPYKDALPTIEIGDGVLLRNFQVVSVKKGFALRSTQDEGSSWVVFKNSGEPEIRGPPVEYGEGEKSHIAALKEWYDGLDTMSMEKINRANGDKGTPSSAGKGMSKA